MPLQLLTLRFYICLAEAAIAAVTVTVAESCPFGRVSGTANTLNVFPNPTKGKFKIEIPEEFRQVGIIQVINPYGATVLTTKVYSGAVTMDLDLGRFKEGIYQVFLNSGKSTLQAKLIKQ